MSGRIRIGFRLALFFVVALFSALCVTWGGMAYWANRTVLTVSRADVQFSFERGVNWLMAHQREVLQDGNSALWWMLNLAANESHDARLQGLVQAFVVHLEMPNGQASPWLRMLDPTLAPRPNEPMEEGYWPYQRFFFHALTCQPQPLDDGRTSAVFLHQNMCRPMLGKVWGHDSVCSTHQLMGLELHRQLQCAPWSQEQLQLTADLVSDVRTQLQVSPVFEDAYLQRVLVMKWLAPHTQQHKSGFEPIWLRRAIQAQGADGGWAGRYQMPEWPNWLQLSALRHLSKLMMGHTSTIEPESDFHATAQGVLLMALSLKD